MVCQTTTTERALYRPVDIRCLERGYLADGRYSLYDNGRFLGNVRVERIGKKGFRAFGCR